MSEYSVVIPAFNAEATLAEALQSVLAQPVPPAEIIVVDDGSTDRTADVAGRFAGSVRCLRQVNEGPGAATSLGLSNVQTPLAATLDADDLWLPTKAERQLAHLASNPSVAANFCLLRQFSADASDPRNGAVSPGWSRSTMFLRTALFPLVGPMRDPPGRRGELVDWLARAREAGARLAMIDEVHALRRIRAGSLSDGRTAHLDRGYLHVARAAIERKRSAKPED